MEVNTRYYFDNTHINERFCTVWYGFLQYEGNPITLSGNYYQKSNRILDDLLTEICDIHFYINLVDNRIYISVDNDVKYYTYDFEKHIKDMILRIEHTFSIHIFVGEFNAIEYKPDSNQYKYTISRHVDKKVILKKKILNWSVYNKKKDVSSLIEKTESLKL